MIASWITPKAEKGHRSAIDGRGLIAREPITAGEVLAVKGGHIMSREMYRALPGRLQQTDIQITDDLYVAALHDDEYEAVMLFLNHSCEPNAGFAGNVVLVAMRDVAAGEELVTDYALFDQGDGVMECRCGAASCRSRITGRDWMRPDLQERYRGYFSSYLARRIDALSEEAVRGG